MHLDPKSSNVTGTPGGASPDFLPASARPRRPAGRWRRERNPKRRGDPAGDAAVAVAVTQPAARMRGGPTAIRPRRLREIGSDATLCTRYESAACIVAQHVADSSSTRRQTAGQAVRRLLSPRRTILTPTQRWSLAEKPFPTKCPAMRGLVKEGPYAAAGIDCARAFAFG